MGDLVIVSASVAEALGGFQAQDPPALLRTEDWDDSWHILDIASSSPAPHLPDGAAFMLPQSAPALLILLARHLGWTLRPSEVPPWISTGDGFRFGGSGTCAPTYFLVDDVPSLADPSNAAFGVIQDPMRGLAAVLVHVAENAR